MFKKVSILIVCVLTWTRADQVFSQDLIVQGSACIGFDCVMGETFGFDTIRLKENNLRINFDDTSASASFPANDWQLTANDSVNGGANRFSIDDVTAGTTPFTVEAGAPTDALHVRSDGKLGIRTTTPILDVHAVSGNTPGLRMDQSGASGFTPQVWDVAGNETNFFVRDVTNGSRLPLRIRPGAPTSSLDIAANGNVGIGTDSPARRLHVFQDGGGSEVAPLRLDNPNGKLRLILASGTEVWTFDNTGANAFSISKVGTGVAEFRLNGDGNLTIQGTLTESSSRSMKASVAPIDTSDVLDRLVRLELSRWSYDGQKARHLGPMAEDFYAAFGLGKDAKHIAPKDMAGVAMASAKALYTKNQELKVDLERKERQITELRERVEKLADIVGQLATKIGAGDNQIAAVEP